MANKKDPKNKDENLSPEEIGKKIEKEHNAVLYVLNGTIKPDTSDTKIKEAFDEFLPFLVSIEQSGRFCWAGILVPNQVMILYEATSDDEAEGIADKNPFLKKTNLIQFDPPKKWFVLYGMGV